MNKAEKGGLDRRHVFASASLSAGRKLPAKRKFANGADYSAPGCGVFLEIELDDAMLRQGCIALSYASGLLPDGTFFQFRDARQGPAPLQIPDNVTGEKVVLALPVRRGGREEVIFSEEKKTRWRDLPRLNRMWKMTMRCRSAMPPCSLPARGSP